MFSRIRTLGVDDLHRVASLLPGTSAQWIAGVTQPPQHAPSIPQKPMRPLADWPPELVFEVMKNLDEVSLLELGATCKQVNALFFAFYSQREGIKIDQHGNVNVCNNTSARHKLRAVRLSLQSSKITHLSVILKPRFDQLESDMAELCRVLRYTTRLREITVHIGSVKRFIDSSGGLDGWMTTTLNALPTFNLTSLVRRYADLADAAESAGCHRMSLDGGDGICNLAMGLCNQRKMREFKVCRQSGVLQNLASRVFQQKRIETPPLYDIGRDVASARAVRSRRATGASGFAKLTVNTNLLWNGIFACWTLDLMQRASTSLTTLELHYDVSLPGSSDERPKIWTEMLSSLQLPALISFSFRPRTTLAFLFSDSRFPNPVTYRNIIKFLYDHPTIKILDLLEIAPPDYLPPEALFISLDAFLPNLKSLRADPQLVQWIFVEKQGALRWLQTLTLPLLPAYLDLFDHSLWDFLQSSQLHRTAKLVFEVRVHNTKLENWFRAQTAGGKPIVELAGLHRVCIRLLLESAEKIWCRRCRCQDSFREALHGWLNLFPDLEELELQILTTVPNPAVLLRQSEIARIVQRFCPKIRLVLVGTSVVYVAVDAELQVSDGLRDELRGAALSGTCTKCINTN